MEGNRKRENSGKERAKYRQEKARPQQESGNEITLAPGRRRRWGHCPRQNRRLHLVRRSKRPHQSSVKQTAAACRQASQGVP